MALAPSTRLGPYEINSAIGAGGMGEVYRAKDTRLGREVAIKVLPANVSVNEERRQRFEREARTISSLNHPNICALYDVGNQDGVEYLVLEYVEGETIEKRLEKGPLPTKALLRYGIEIADALEKAHRTGVIHRDLKPSNIMLTKSGAKLLDFGLAKWSETSPSEAETLKTLTGTPEKLTQEGTLVGTFRYMAPEQLEGKEVDSRTDLFAFGEVLYEMATGVPAFSGNSKASLIAAILTADPKPITKLQPVCPAALDQLVQGCLAKDPDERWQSAHDVKLELRALEARSGEAEPFQAAASRWRKWERLAWAAGLALASTLLVWHFSRSAPDAPRMVRSSLLPPSDSSYESFNFAVSPDGARLAFVAVGREGKSTLWVRSLSVASAQEFSATEGAMYPFWSPDSQRVGFFAVGKLKTVDPENGAVKILCNAPSGRGGTWNRDGMIVFAPDTIGPLYKVADRGGELTPVTKIAREGSGEAHRWPFFLPDGDHFMYLVDWSGPADGKSNGIYAGSLGSKQSKLVSADILSNVAFTSGRLVFVRDRSLMAQAFDTARLELSGSAQSIVEQGLLTDTGFRNSGYSISQNGMLVFQSAADLSSQLIWFDRTGKELGKVPGAGYRYPRVSPDGRKLLISSDDERNGKYFLRVYDLERGISTRVTDGGSEEEAGWSRDGKRIAYVTGTGNTFYLYDIPADGSSVPKLLLKGAMMRHIDRSPDDHISFLSLQGHPALSVYSPADHQVSEIAFPGAEARFSPDGRWIAYTGRGIVVQPFPGPGGRIQISDGHGSQAVWSRDGREITYIAPDRKLMSVTFDAAKKSATAPRALFQTRIEGPAYVSHQYDVSPDGRFIINSLASSNSAPLTLLENWTAEIKK
ncbi:MAG TPA: protein kinase [Verrucomicrobiae bacterium]|nr:protein kinase [Verrucomicrobiae bacterium]